MVVSLLHNDKIKNREVRADNAASHRLTATLTIAPSITPEARGASMHQDPYTALSENSLLHGEALLVTASHDLEHIALEFISKSISTDLLGQSLVKERPEFLVIVNFNLLLAPCSRVCNVELRDKTAPKVSAL
jgi:hypothetical protein